MRTIGTRALGVRTPIIRESDDLVSIVCQSLKEAQDNENIIFNDGDIIGVTEAVVARAQGNYATTAQIAADVRRQFPDGHIGVVFPILSRNRFAMELKGIAMGAKQVTVMLSYPADEVGNQLVSWEDIDDKGLNPYSDCLDEKKYRDLFGNDVKHIFTGVDYLDYYKSLHNNIEIIFCSDPKAILKYTKNIIVADIHTRARTKRALLAAGAEKVIGREDVLSQSIDGSGYNEEYGLLGANTAGEDRLKLFPRDCGTFVEACSQALRNMTGKHIEVLVYGDGGFKDPVGGIWELADPVISPAFTSGLQGTPNEIKLKYLADNTFGHMDKDAARAAVEKAIEDKDGVNLMGKMASLGTTPRQISDLLGSLCDLISGSGDKGTPVILIQGYFDNYAS